MNAAEQARVDPFYTGRLRALKLQGKAEKAVEAYARTIRCTAEFFDHCPDDPMTRARRTCAPISPSCCIPTFRARSGSTAVGCSSSTPTC